MASETEAMRHEEFRELYDQIAGDVKRATVDKMQHMAMAYVWGWQDRMSDHNSQTAIAFGLWYGAHAARYELELSWARMPIQDAWKYDWRESEKLGVRQ